MAIPTMTLTELKQLLGMDAGDTSNDVSLSLYLEAGLMAAMTRTTALDWTKLTHIPGPVKLGIARWVDVTRTMADRSGVQSESIGGMSQTFKNTANDADLYAEVYMLWDAFRLPENRSLQFRPSRRKGPVRNPLGGGFY